MSTATNGAPPRDGDTAAVYEEVARLRPWKDNPRLNDGHPVERVAESIARFGFAGPIVARPNGEIIAGHTRYKAAKSLGLSVVPVRYMDLNDTEAHLLAVTDNRVGEVARWDIEKLQDVLSSYDDSDVALAGFDDVEFDEWAREVAASDEAAMMIAPVVKGKLAESFGVPTFSILDAR